MDKKCTLVFFPQNDTGNVIIIPTRNWFLKSFDVTKLQLNLCQKHSFLNQLTHSVATDISLNYEFSTRKVQVQNMLYTENYFECQN